MRKPFPCPPARSAALRHHMRDMCSLPLLLDRLLWDNPVCPARAASRHCWVKGAGPGKETLPKSTSSASQLAGQGCTGGGRQTLLQGHTTAVNLPLNRARHLIDLNVILIKDSEKHYDLLTHPQCWGRGLLKRRNKKLQESFTPIHQAARTVHTSSAFVNTHLHIQGSCTNLQVLTRNNKNLASSTV